MTERARHTFYLIALPLGHFSVDAPGGALWLVTAAAEMMGRRETSSRGLIYAAMDGVGALGGVLAGLAGSADLRMALAFSAALCLLFAVLALAHPFSGPAPEAAETAPA
jgi:hypothetical protein